jgi:hypothetical protein
MPTTRSPTRSWRSSKADAPPLPVRAGAPLTLGTRGLAALYAGTAYLLDAF